MAEAPAPRKRAVATSRAKVAARKPTPTPRKSSAATIFLDDEPEVPNYGLRLTEGIDEETSVATYARPRARKAPNALEPEDTFALSLSKALEAIHAAQSPAEEAPAPAAPKPSIGGFWAALDKLPPIRLPIGPAIPWRLGLPALIALVIVMGIMSRTAGASDTQGVQLPAQQTYPVQQEAPLFTQATPTAVPAQDSGASQTVGVQDLPAPDTSASQTIGVQDLPAPDTSASQPIGVQDPAGMSFDFVDIGIKLIAVLALAYGSLLLLKKVGIGDAGSPAAGAGTGQNVRVVSSLALAPNRSVHVIRVPGGKTLLVGATPSAVNFLADLGELADDQTPEAASFLDALKSKLH